MLTILGVILKTKNPCGDLPLHLACYGGQTPPFVVRALLQAYPEGAHVRNDGGFTPLQLARVNYRTDHPFREEVLEFLEVYTNGNANTPEEQEEDLISLSQYDDAKPIVSYQTSATCVICLENEADHVVIPCGHQCLCGDCAKKVLAVGRSGNSNSNNNNGNDHHETTITKQRFCPVGRCKIAAIVKVSAPPACVEASAPPLCVEASAPPLCASE